MPHRRHHQHAEQDRPGWPQRRDIVRRKLQPEPNLRAEVANHTNGQDLQRQAYDLWNRPRSAIRRMVGLFESDIRCTHRVGDSLFHLASVSNPTLSVLPLTLANLSQSKCRPRTAQPRKTDPSFVRSFADFDGGSGQRRSRGGLKAAHDTDSTAQPKCAKSPQESPVLTHSDGSDMVLEESRRGGRAVEFAGFENG